MYWKFIFLAKTKKNSKDYIFEEWNDLKQSASELFLYSLQQQNPLIQWIAYKGLSELISKVYINNFLLHFGPVREIQSCN